MRTTCKKAQTLIGCSLDGELPSRWEKVLTAHLSECGACKQEYEKLVKLHTLIRDSVTEEIVQERYGHLWKLIEQNIAKKVLSPFTLFKGLFYRRAPLLVPAVVVSLFIIIGISVWLLSTSLFTPPIAPNECIVQFISCNTSPLMVYKDPDTNTTIIWYFEAGREAS